MRDRIMSLRCGWAAGLWLAVVPAVAAGQVVQLPTYHNFSVNTTVSVPDGGAAYLGGVNRARVGAVSRGAPGLSQLPIAGRLFGNRGIGSSHSSSAACVSATIIDLQEWDRAVLAAGAARRDQNEADAAVARKAAFISRHVARRDPARPLATRRAVASRSTLSGDRESAISAAKQREAEAASLFADGRAAEAAGKRGAAKVYYHMAARRASGKLKEQVNARIAALQADDAPRLATRETP